MSTVTQNPSTARQSNSAFWAWMGVVFTPVLLFVGMAAAWQIADWLGEDFSQDLTFGQTLAVFVPAAIIWLAAPVFGLVKGIQASREGSRSGTVAAVVAGLLALALLISVIAEFL